MWDPLKGYYRLHIGSGPGSYWYLGPDPSEKISPRTVAGSSRCTVQKEAVRVQSTQILSIYIYIYGFPTRNSNSCMVWGICFTIGHLDP